MSGEIWKDIPDYEGIYEASTLGRIRTVEGKTTRSELHGVRHWKQRVLKGRGEGSTGYRVSLFKNGRSRDFLVARLVAMTFLGIPEKKLTVNHKDLNRHNNRIENLEWLTNADNIRHGFENGAYPQMKITLIAKDKSEHSFRSLAQASKFLGHSNGYVSLALKIKRPIRDIEGSVYEFKRDC